MTAPAPHPDRAEQAQPSGYVPPVVGAPTWPRKEDLAAVAARYQHAREVGRDADPTEGRGEITRAHLNAFVACWQDIPELVREVGRLREQVNELRADRDRLRDVIASAYVDLLAGRVDEAAGVLRAAGGQP